MKKIRLQFRTIYPVLLVCIFLTGCTIFEARTPPPTPEGYSILNRNQTIGQTFVALNSGLNGIRFFLMPENDYDGEITLHLRESLDAPTDIFSSVLTAREIVSEGYYLFNFETLKNSFRQYYYAFLEYQGDGELKVGYTSSATYLDGAMNISNEPTTLQTSFELVYNKSIASMGLGREFLYWVYISAVGILLFVLPGFTLLLKVWPPFMGFSLITKFGISIGMSLALYPILFLWTDVLGIHIGSYYAWLGPLVCSVILFWHLRGVPIIAEFRKRVNSWRHSTGFSSDLTLIGLTLLIAAGRYYSIRTIDMPMWGDSVHHATITQLIVDNGGLFDSWEPYAELQSLTYHFGFHTHSAVFHWVTNIPVPQSIMWVGQIFSVFAVLSLYPLVRRIGGNRWAATISILIAGSLSYMPNFYANWGRYTQLAGQVILPTAIFIIWNILENRSLDWRQITPAFVVLAGLALTHYRVAIFAVLFFAAFILLRLRFDQVRTISIRTSIIGIGAGILFLPWFINTFSGTITTNFIQSLATPVSETTSWTQQYNAIGGLDRYLHPILWILSGIGAAYALVRREKKILTFMLWWAIILLATNPQWLKLPGEGAISNFALFIAAYIPASVIISIALGDVFQQMPHRLGPLFSLLLIGIGVWGTAMRMSDIDPEAHSLATRPDIRAASWIRENTDSNAVFLTQALFAYNDISIVGSDGGWWLPLLTDRRTTLPPLSYSSEKGPIPKYRQWINAVWALLIEKGITDNDVLAELESRGVTHIYLGQRQGRVNNMSENYLDPEVLEANKAFSTVYHQDHVWIFQIVD